MMSGVELGGGAGIEGDAELRGAAAIEGGGGAAIEGGGGSAIEGGGGGGGGGGSAIEVGTTVISGPEKGPLVYKGTLTVV